jgi:enoyl-CoA hydratase
MSTGLVGYTLDGPLAWITLNRPAKLNAINGEMLRGIDAALDRAEADEQVRVILLHGEGRAFSAGFDLQMEADPADSEATSAELRHDFATIMRFWHSPKPTIAAVHGYCLGSAMEMALACDITLAAEDCRFGAPEVRFGSGIVALLLPWLCGPKRAKELLLTGNDKVSAAQAEAWGLVNRVVAAEALSDTARELAMGIAGNDALAVQLTKRAINETMAHAGMHQALEAALVIDIEVETTERDPPL